MKKYLIVTGILNIVLAFIVSKILVGYLNLSITNDYGNSIDTLCLLGSVLIIAIINFIYFKISKVKGRKIYIAVPVIIFMLTTGILLFACH